jgi:DNA polymerase III alpha subunit
MLVTAAPLIDIAPIERATMQDRVVVQFDKRDVEELKLIKLDLLGLGMLAAIDETLQLIEHDCATCVVLDAIPEQVPEVFEMIQAADTVGVFQIESRARCRRCRSPGRPRWTISSWRSRSSGRARSRATRSTRTCGAGRASSR